MARLSTLSVWFIKLGIYPELIEPGQPQQNGVHERMHSTLKQQATVPPDGSLPAQERNFDRFRGEFNQERPHEALGMMRPAELYQSSSRSLPRRLEPYDYLSHYLVRRVSRWALAHAERHFFLVDPSGERPPKNLTDSPDWDDYDPAWSPDRVRPAASHVPSGTVDKAGLEWCGPADCGMVVLQYDRAYQASEVE